MAWHITSASAPGADSDVPEDNAVDPVVVPDPDPSEVVDKSVDVDTSEGVGVESDHDVFSSSSTLTLRILTDLLFLLPVGLAVRGVDKAAVAALGGCCSRLSPAPSPRCVRIGSPARWP